MSSSTSRKHRAGGGSHGRGAHGHAGRGGDGGHGEGGGGGGGGGGRLVKVAFGRNQAEAELLQGLLSEAGIPSVLKRSGGFDNPDFLSAGPHDVWVNQGNETRAREVLADTLIEDEAEERGELDEEAALRRDPMTGRASPGRLALWLLVAVAAAFLLVWILWELT